jgi:hypothetical protein
MTELLGSKVLAETPCIVKQNRGWYRKNRNTLIKKNTTSLSNTWTSKRYRWTSCTCLPSEIVGGVQAVDYVPMWAIHTYKVLLSDQSLKSWHLNFTFLESSRVVDLPWKRGFLKVGFIHAEAYFRLKYLHIFQSQTIFFFVFSFLNLHRYAKK